MTTTIVTGGGGFLGSHLCKQLLDQGREVICIDNFVTGRRPNLGQLSDKNHLTVIEGDVVNPPKLPACDEIYHLASMASPKEFGESPVEIAMTNTLGTKRFLDHAKDCDAKFLFASTSEVYGDPEVNPQTEDYHGNVDPFGPRSCYDESKRCGEALVRAYRDKHAVEVAVARIFNTYGPRMRVDDGRVVPNFVCQALTGADLTVYGDGEQTRSFCYVSDLIDGLVRLQASDVHSPVNIGNPDERTINELAEVVLDVTDSESGITHEELPPQDPQVRRPDISKAKATLGWEPQVSLVDGLEQTVKYFRDQV